MTPKEKAKDLFDKFYLSTKDITDILKVKSKDRAKTCAIIAIKDTLDILYYLSDTSSIVVEERDFYEQVLIEITSSENDF